MVKEVFSIKNDLGFEVSVRSYGGTITSWKTPADIVLAQYPRLGASGAWLSRSFFAPPYQLADMADGVAAIRQRLTQWHDARPAQLDEACRAMLRLG